MLIVVRAVTIIATRNVWASRMNDQTFTRRAIIAQRATGDLRARLYREIGLCAVAEALEVETPPVSLLNPAIPLSSILPPDAGREI